jgi:transposase InsO family protein
MEITESGILMTKVHEVRNQREHRLLVVPAAMQNDILHMYHDQSGHPGGARLFGILNTRFYWEHMRNDAHTFAKSCYYCQSYKANSGLSAIHTPLHPLPAASYPFQRIHTDVCEFGVSSENGYKYCLVIICNFTKFLITTQLFENTSKSIIRAFTDNFVHKYGAPSIIVSDKGTVYGSREFENFCKLHNVEHITANARSQKSNGSAEICIKTLSTIMATICSASMADWTELLSYATHLCNTTIHSIINESPFYALHGYDPIRVGENAELMQRKKYSEIDDYLADISTNMIIMRKTIEARLQQNRPLNEDAYNARYRTKLPALRQGTLVMRLMPNLPVGVHKKSYCRWRGPFRIEEISGSTIKAHAIDTPQKLVTFAIDEAKLFFDEYHPIREIEISSSSSNKEEMNQRRTEQSHEKEAREMSVGKQRKKEQAIIEQQQPSLGSIIVDGQRRSARVLNMSQ